METQKWERKSYLLQNLFYLKLSHFIYTAEENYQTLSLIYTMNGNIRDILTFKSLAGVILFYRTPK